MTLRNVPESFTLEQQRLEINELAVDLDTAVDGVQTFSGNKTFTGSYINFPDPSQITAYDLAVSNNFSVTSTANFLSGLSTTGDISITGNLSVSGNYSSDLDLPANREINIGGLASFGITGNGTDLEIKNNKIYLKDNSGVIHAIFKTNAGADLYYGPDPKLGTDANGAWVIGDITFGQSGTSFTFTDIANWDTAYGWGDHGSAGYITALTDTLASVTGRGSITSENLTFNGNIQFNDDTGIADNKVLNFGASSDGRISYTSSTNRFYVRTPGGSADLILGAGPAIRITNENGLTDRAVFTASGATITGNTDITGNIDVTGTATLSGITFPSSTGSNGEVLTSDGAGGTAWGTAVPSGNSSVIAPVAYAFVDVATAGTGTGMTWGAYDSANGEMDFTFDTAQSDADYYVLSEREQYDTHTVSITNKSTTGFTATWLGNDGTSPLSPATFGGVLLVYASTPTVSVVGGGGGSNYVLPTASASTLGGIKVGSGLTINTGVLSTSGSSSYSTISNFPSASSSEGSFGYADDTNIMYYSNGVSWTSQRLVTTNSTTSSDFATLLGNTQITYDVSVVDYTAGTTAENNARKIIRLGGSNGITDEIVLVAGTGLAISDSGDEIQFDLTADIANSTYSISAETAAGAASSKLTLTDNAGTTDDITFAGADGLVVERTDANTLTFRAPSGASGGSYTTEDAQDAAGLLFSNGTHTGITFTYDDNNNSIDAVVTGGGGGGGTTYDLLGSNTTSNNAILTLRDAANNDDAIEFAGSNGTDITWDSANGRITINSTAPVQSDWDATTGLAQILNKPSIPSAYTLPAATTSTLGGVIPDGTTITLDASGNISAVAGGYTLPIAAAGTLGGIRVGSGLSIDGAGVLTATGGSSVPQIQDLTGTTSSLADDATAELNITGYKAYSLFKIEVDAAAWVRVYTDDTSRDADQTRSEGADPSPGSGVIAEVRTTTAESILITPGIMGFNNDSPRTTTIYLSVTNRSGGTSTVTVTLTALQIGE